ncbi:hypothetical protein [Candidatus Parabeggiatoa sp. HSG14]|nr:hypothetical protein [Thiotrichales bacterium HSG14]
MDVESTAYVYTLQPEYELKILSEAEDVFAITQKQPTQQNPQNKWQ